MIEIDVKKMRELAKKVTPGPWSVDTESLDGHGRLYVSKGSSNYLLGRILEVFQNCLVRSEQRMAANAEYIAAVDPQTILALLDRLEAAEKARKDAILDAERARDERNRVHVRLNAEWIEKTKTLSERLEAAEKDAERWRVLVKWIVENDGLSTHDFDFTYQPSGYNGSHFCWVELGWRHPQWEAPTEAQVNAAIDAAIAQRQGEKS